MKKQLLLFTIILFSFNLTAQFGLDLDGNFDRVIVPSITTSTTFTLEAWINVRTLSSGFHTLIEGSNDSPYFGFSNNRLILYVLGGGTVASDPVVFPLNEWVHVAVTCTPGDQRLYRNGVEVASGTAASIPTGSGLGIGFNFGDNALNTQVDEVRIWNIIRTQAEIDANKDICLSGTEVGLEAYYQFQDGAGSSIVTDIAGGDNPGTLTDMDPSTDWITTPVGCQTLSQNDFQFDNEITVFPNPTKNNVTIGFSNLKETVEVRVSNILGQLVSRKQYQSVDQISLILEGQSGVYFVEVIADDKASKTIRVIKN